jgi:uncharacterized protein with PIN domain
MKARFGEPARCPYCGGPLRTCFGITVDDHGRRIAVADSSLVQCEDCRRTHKLVQDVRQGQEATNHPEQHHE